MDGYDAKSNNWLEMLDMVRYVVSMSEGAAEMDVKGLAFESVKFE